MLAPTELSPSIKDELEKELHRREAIRELSRRHLLRFLKHFKPHENYHFGRHTIALCNLLEQVTLDVESGRSRYVIFVCPPRHGKSDIASRRYPIWHLGRNPEHEIILATYGASLSAILSRDARRVVSSTEYARTFGITLSKDSRSVADWTLSNNKGKFHAVGIEGAITGHGANILIIDDYCKGRKEAESELIRNSIWDAFCGDLMTRLAPVRGVVIVANRWHSDDLVARIQKEMKENAEFPRFETVTYPAWDEEYGWLFPERFSEEWYQHERALTGSYMWQAQFQGQPVSREGNLFEVAKIQYYEDSKDNLRFIRVWDLASSEKERTSRDPDFTVGGKVALSIIGGLPNLYIDDIVFGRWKAPERDRKIKATAELDTPHVPQIIETVAGYKDTGAYMKDYFKGRFVFKEYSPHNDKVVRATPLEPIFEGGRVHIRRNKSWNEPFISEITAFPEGKHDDMIDMLSSAYSELRGSGIRISRV